MTVSFFIIEKLAQEIVDKTIDADAEPDAVFSALMMAFEFWMSCVCGDCRQNVACKLKERIPMMLEHANQFAATSQDKSSKCH